jgi:hypothetical protein
MSITEVIILKTFEKSQPLKACELGMKRSMKVDDGAWLVPIQQKSNKFASLGIKPKLQP